jgi:hypothetical protein
MVYVADGELEGVADGDVDAVADGELDGVDDGDADEITVPTLPESTSHLKVVAVSETLISDRKSEASANVAVVSSATFSPAAAVSTASPPPSVFKRMTSRMPGFVGLASVRVSPEAPVTISQICKSAVARMIPALPGSFRIFGPL